MRKILSYFLLSLIIFNVLFVFLGAYLYPLASIDAVSIWYLKAKAFYFQQGNIPISVLKNALYLNSHPQYPLLVPFLFYIAYFFLGGIKENVIAFVNPLLYALTIYVVYKLIKKLNFSTIFSLLFTYIYSMFSPLLAQGGRKHSGDADIFIVFLNWLSIFLAFNLLKERKKIYLYLLIVIIMISSQVKAEGVFLSSILFFIPFSKRLRLFSIVISILPFVAWRLFIYNNHIPNDFYFILPSIGDLVSRSFNITLYTVKEMLKINNWYIFWPLFWLSLTLIKIKKDFIGKMIIPSLVLYTSGFLIFYLFLSISPKIYVPPSIDRVLLQLSPFYFLIFANIIREEIFHI